MFTRQIFAILFAITLSVVSIGNSAIADGTAGEGPIGSPILYEVAINGRHVQEGDSVDVGGQLNSQGVCEIPVHVQSTKLHVPDIEVEVGTTVTPECQIYVEKIQLSLNVNVNVGTDPFRPSPQSHPWWCQFNCHDGGSGRVTYSTGGVAEYNARITLTVEWNSDGTYVDFQHLTPYCTAYGGTAQQWCNGSGGNQYGPFLPGTGPTYVWGDLDSGFTDGPSHDFTMGVNIRGYPDATHTCQFRYGGNYQGWMTTACFG